MYLDVVLKELLAIRFRQRDRVFDFRAAGIGAEMPVPHGRQTHGVIILSYS